MSLDPYRARYGAPRPPRMSALVLPPEPMPARRGTRPLKAWRYVAVFSDEFMLCAARVRIGPLRQQFWALWDRGERRLHQRTILRPAGVVTLQPGHLRIADRDVEIDVRLAEEPGVETVCPQGEHYAWTRKQAAVPAAGSVRLGARVQPLRGLAVVDDTAGYHRRHTSWRWSAGVGHTVDGRVAGWNLVEGLNDPPRGSERTVWLGGRPQEAPPVAFAHDLSAVDDLRFSAEATRVRHDNVGLLRSDYEQPFGTFAGTLPGGVELERGMGVMERHDVRW